MTATARISNWGGPLPAGSWTVTPPTADVGAAAECSFDTDCACPTNRTLRSPRAAEFELPCRQDPEMWFAEAPAQLQLAKALCAACPIRLSCLAVAIHGAEYSGVWGGHIIERGRIIPSKRGRGRPRVRGRRLPPTESRPVQELDIIDDAVVTRTCHNRLCIAARQLHDAECALHGAHRSGVDARVATANENLHEAVTEYVAAMETAMSRSVVARGRH